MSKLILLSCMLIQQFSFSQEKITLEKASDNIEKILSNQIEKSKPNIFIADIETIDSIVKLTKKNIK